MSLRGSRLFIYKEMNMKRYVPQTMFIKGNDSWETARLFNEAMVELAELNPTYEREGDSYWVFYKTEICREAEEPFVAPTSDAHCEDCPYSMRDLNRYGNIDARKKWATCGKTGERIHVESRACEIYEMLAERRKE